MQNRVTVGCTIKFAGYDWRVLDIKTNKALLISKKMLEMLPYHEKAEKLSWKDCSLRSYLNFDFYYGLNKKSRLAIVETINTNTKNPWYGTSGGDMSCDRVFILSIEEVARYFGNSGALKQQRGGHIKYFRVKNNKFIEVEKPDTSQWCCFGDRFDSARIVRNKDGKAQRWWLRTPGDNERHAAYVFDNGTVDVGGMGVSIEQNNEFYFGVRPALWLNL